MDSLRHALLTTAAALIGVLTMGCSHPRSLGLGSGEEFAPQNFHQSTAWLPREMRRVAVLPMTATSFEALNPSSRDQLELLLPAELNRTELFEVVRVTPEQLRRWTGRPRWGVTEALPPDLFARIRSQLGCDGVVFAHLTAYRPYPPLVMGWKLHLVDAREPQIWWTCDVVYDAGNQAVARNAVHYEREHQVNHLSASDPATILRSPGRFGQYTLATSLQTLQRHEKNN